MNSLALPIVLNKSLHGALHNDDVRRLVATDTHSKHAHAVARDITCAEAARAFRRNVAGESGGSPLCRRRTAAKMKRASHYRHINKTDLEGGRMPDRRKRQAQSDIVG